MQRIEVKNFGPLKDINLEIKDYMVFIGPQASGKSTLAKLIYFFWKVESDIYRKEIIPNYILSKISDSNFNGDTSREKLLIRIRELLQEIFPTYRNGQIKFIYSNDAHIQIDIVRLSERLNDDVIVSDSFFSDFIEFEDQIKNITDNKFFLKDGKEDKKQRPKHQLDFFANVLLNNILDNASGNVIPEIIYIPAGRSILSLLANSFQLVESNSLDYFNESFIRFTNKIRNFIGSPDYDSRFGLIGRSKFNTLENDIFSIANQLSFEILRGDFQTSDRGDGIRQGTLNSGYVVPLKHTSSGQQESAWLINTIQYLLFDSAVNCYDAIIEEPEAHLFTTAQRDIANLITLLSNKKNNKTRLIITTHSPYILATLNNSIKAYTTAQIESKAREVELILNKELWINPDDLFAGYMEENTDENNFCIKNIYNSELNLISHKVLDDISDNLMDDFDKLLEIEYSE